MTPEFSKPFDLADASDVARYLKFEASPEACAALAQRFEVVSITAVKADITIKPQADGYSITGDVSGGVEQACVVTGKTVASQVKAPLNTLLWTKPVEGDLDMLEEAYQVNEIVPIEETSVDLGELCAQHFSLAIDPFPRSKGANLDAKVPQEKTNPFSVLAQLKDKA